MDGIEANAAEIWTYNEDDMRFRVTIRQVNYLNKMLEQDHRAMKRVSISCCRARVKTLNHALGTVFKRWYPDMEVEEMPDAA